MIDKTHHYLTVAQYFFLGCMLGMMAGIWLHNPKPKDIEFVNPRGNKCILRFMDNGRGVVEEWIKPEEEPQPRNSVHNHMKDTEQ